MASDLEAFDLPAELQDAITADSSCGPEANPEHFTVLEENWVAVTTFLSFETQWRPEWKGLDYTPLLQYLRLKYRHQWEDIFNQVRAIECGAVSEINKIKSKSDG